MSLTKRQRLDRQFWAAVDEEERLERAAYVCRCERALAAAVVKLKELLANFELDLDEFWNVAATYSKAMGFADRDDDGEYPEGHRAAPPPRKFYTQPYF